MLSEKRLVLIALALAIAVSIFSHSMIWREWYYPTYGNTNVHVAFAQHLLKHGEYPLQNDYSYGGGIPSLYVPGYRIVLAGTMALVGNADFAQRLLVMLFALLLPIGFFLLARELFGNIAGIAAAFFASLPSELLIYTVRPLPQALGLVLLPFAFYAIAANKKKTALALTLAIALVHQEAIVFLAAGAFAFAFFSFAVKFTETKKISLPKEAGWTALLCWALALVAYAGWHFFVLGNVNVFDLAQFSQHEGNAVAFNYYLEKTGLVVGIGGILGLVLLTARNALQPKEKELLLIALALTGFLFVKNDLLGVKVFMDRFLVFLQIPLAILAAFVLKEALAYTTQFAEKILFPKESL
ncbi:MAG: hypothetical protein V1717_02640 [Candidatus Micrarchaeota archaeon]